MQNGIGQWFEFEVHVADWIDATAEICLELEVERVSFWNIVIRFVAINFTPVR